MCSLQQLADLSLPGASWNPTKRVFIDELATAALVPYVKVFVIAFAYLIFNSEFAACCVLCACVSTCVYKAVNLLGVVNIHHRAPPDVNTTGSMTMTYLAALRQEVTQLLAAYMEFRI